MEHEMAAAVHHYVLTSRYSSTYFPPNMEALGADLAEAKELDNKHKCVVNNSYFRVWQDSSNKRSHIKLNVWCLGRNGSVLHTVQEFASISEKPKSPLILFLEALLKPGMDVEEIKKTRIEGAKVWRAMSPEEQTLWKEKATGAQKNVAQPQRKERIAFKLVMSLVREEMLEPVINMLRKLDNAQSSAFNIGDGKEPALLATLRGVLRSAFLEAPFRASDECMCEYWDAINADLGTSIEDYKQCMVCSDLGHNIFHVQFTHQLVMASTMLRLQERYECPNDELRGRCFSMAEYKAWERKNDPARGFRYYEHWPGFNVPGSVVKAALQEDELLPREQALKQVLGDRLSLPNFYVIGTKIGDKSGSLYHEVCHAMYEVNVAYRADVDAELAQIAEGPMRRMKAFLLCEQYANVERILQDEVHAYLSEGDKLGCTPLEVSPHTQRLQAIFSKHAGELGYLLTGVLAAESDESSSSDDD